MELNNYKDTLRKLYNIAAIEGYQVRRKQEESGSRSLSDISLEDIIRERKDSELLQYLQTLDDGTIRVVMAVMYIGRDYPLADGEQHVLAETGDDDEEMDEIYPIEDPNDEVEKYIDYIDNRDKTEIVVNQIFGKRMNLDLYLKRAFKILGI